MSPPAVLGLTLRDNLEAADAQLGMERQYLVAIIERLRLWRPRLVVTPHWDDHHPDHHYTSLLVRDACYLAGLPNYPASGTAHRPEQVLYYLDRVATAPHLIQDVSTVFEQKRQAVTCYASQFRSENNTNDDGHATLLSAADFLARWRARHVHFGSLIGVTYGEGYVVRSPVALNNPMALLWGRQGVV